MTVFPRITRNPSVMGGKACIRGMRVTVGMILGNLSVGAGIDELLEAYPYLERDDVLEAIRYGAWLAQEREIDLVPGGVRFVIDMNLSIDWIDYLAGAGHDAVHWSQIGAADASDETIVDWARDHDRIVFTNDLDFGTLLAMSGASSPSVVQLRTDTTLSARIGPLVVQALARAEVELLSGAILTIEAERLRLRALDFARKE